MGWGGPLTHRQHLAWLEWDFEQWNRPSRTDHYLMQIGMEVAKAPARVWGTDPKELTVNHWKLEFGQVKPEVRQPKPTAAQESEPEMPRIKGIPRRVTKEDIDKVEEFDALAKAKVRTTGKAK